MVRRRWLEQLTELPRGLAKLGETTSRRWPLEKRILWRKDPDRARLAEHETEQQRSERSRSPTAKKKPEALLQLTGGAPGVSRALPSRQQG